MDDLCNEIRNDIRDYALQSGMTFYDIRAQHGLLRDIMVRNSNTGEWMVLVQFHYDEDGDDERAKALWRGYDQHGRTLHRARLRWRGHADGSKRLVS